MNLKLTLFLAKHRKYLIPAIVIIVAVIIYFATQ